MITKTYISESLRQLDAGHRKAKNQRHAYYFAKLAILEICGWVEMSMDDIILRHCARHLNDESNNKFIEKQVVNRTYGFDYDRHFRAMLIRLVGMVATEKIEMGISAATDAHFKAELTSLKAVRDQLAHTYVKRVGVIDAPSRTRARFQPLYQGLLAYDKALRAL
jgi:hypothetical protein